MTQHTIYKNVLAALFGLIVIPGMIGCSSLEELDSRISSRAALTQDGEEADEGVDMSEDAEFEDEEDGGEDFEVCEALLEGVETLPEEDAELVVEDFIECLEDIVEHEEDEDDEDEFDDEEEDDEEFAEDEDDEGDDEFSDEMCDPILDGLDTSGLTEEDEDLIIEDYEECVILNGGELDDEFEEEIEACEVILEGLEVLPPEYAELVVDVFVDCLDDALEHNEDEEDEDDEEECEDDHEEDDEGEDEEEVEED